MTGWRSIKSAPRNGTPVRIRGLRFISEEPYEAVALFTTRCCPAKCTGWFPASDKHDGEGPYMDVTHWCPLEEGEPT